MGKDKKDTYSSDNNLDNILNEKIEKNNKDKSSEDIFESTGDQIDKLLDSQFPELSKDKSNLKEQQEIKLESTEEPLDKFTVKTKPDDEIKEEDILVLDESLALPEESELSSEKPSIEKKSDFQDFENIIFEDLEPKVAQSIDINKNKKIVQDKEFPSIEIEEVSSASLEQEKTDVLILESTHHLQEDGNKGLKKEVISEDFEPNSLEVEEKPDQQNSISKEKPENKESNEAVMFVDGKKVNIEEILNRDHIEPIEIDSIQEQLESIKKNGYENIKEEEAMGEERMDIITPPEHIPEIKPITQISFDKPLIKKRTSRLPFLMLLLAVIAVGAYFVLIKNNKQDLIESNAKSPKEESKNIEIQSKPFKNKKRVDIRELETINLKTFFKKAENYIKNGDVHNAKLQMILAEKITPPDNMLKRKKNIQNSIKSLEKKNEIKNQKIKQSIIIEDVDFKKAESYNTIESYNKYLNKYPSGKFKFKAKSNIKKLNKEKIKEELNLIRSKTRQHQRIQLRFGHMEFEEKDIKKIELLLANLKNRFEKRKIRNEKIIIDYSTGLMWHLWETQMDYYKAEWWTTRGYAGLFNWRIPTLEEALSISTIDFEYFSNKSLSSIQIWTKDKVSSESATIWTLDLKKKECTSSEKSSFKYLFSCRKIQK
jgi:hypothetical protein